MTHRLPFSLTSIVLLSFVLLPACGSYDLTINEQVVYTPDPLFEDFDIADTALRECVERAIASHRVTAASQMHSLNCSNAGINALDGLSTFSEIEQLRLSTNNIRDLSELGALTALQELYLDDNQVVEAVALYQLPALRLVDLSGNADLLCPSSAALLRLDTVILPAHCPSAPSR